MQALKATIEDLEQKLSTLTNDLLKTSREETTPESSIMSKLISIENLLGNMPSGK